MSVHYVSTGVLYTHMYIDVHFLHAGSLPVISRWPEVIGVSFCSCIVCTRMDTVYIILLNVSTVTVSCIYLYIYMYMYYTQYLQVTVKVFSVCISTGMLVKQYAHTLM